MGAEPDEHDEHEDDGDLKESSGDDELVVVVDSCLWWRLVRLPLEMQKDHITAASESISEHCHCHTLPTDVELARPEVIPFPFMAESVTSQTGRKDCNSS